MRVFMRSGGIALGWSLLFSLPLFAQTSPGTIFATGLKYTNRFCSIIKIENRKITHWRDYMDSLAAWNALTAQTH